MLPLYPYKPSKIRVVFVYATNAIRQRIYVDFLKFWLSANFSTVTISLLLSAGVLVFIRHRAGIRNDGIIVGYIEIMCVAIGGGSIRANHKWERIFFAILMVTLFFIVSIFMADFSMSSSIPDNLRNITSFEELAQQNVTFYIGSSLQHHKDVIVQMLR